MKETYRKGVANHPGPESCVAGHQKAGGEALTGVKAGWVSSREMELFQGADAVKLSGRQYGGSRYREAPPPCAVGDPRHAWKLDAREPRAPTRTRVVCGPFGEADEA